MIRLAWDRPEMLRDGANLNAIPALKGAQFWVAIVLFQPVALFIGIETAADTLDTHVCMKPECRGSAALTALAGFFEYVKSTTQYRRITGRIPAYNRPMVQVALRTGCRITGKIRESVLRNRIWEDEILMERRLA